MAAALLLLTVTTVIAAPGGNHAMRFKVNPLHLEGKTSRDWVNIALRDEAGYLWVGTDNGLRRYDGYEYTVFNNHTSEGASNAVSSLLIGSDRTLWIGGRMLSAFNSELETFENYPVTKGHVIAGMTETPDRILWITGEGFGLIGFDTRRREMIYHSANSSGELLVSVTDVIRDQHDPFILWMTATTGLFRFDSRIREIQTLYNAQEMGALLVATTSSLRMDREGKIWMVTGNGLFVVDPASKSFRHYKNEQDNPHSLSTNILTSVLIDSKDRGWIGTDKQGAHIYRPETDDFLHIPASAAETDAFGPAAINDIYEDREGSLWFSMGPLGVQRISEHLEKFIAIGSGGGEQQLSFDLLLDLEEDRDGGIWIATDGGGLNRYDPRSGRIARYAHDPDNPRSISSNSVISLEEDRRGRLWIGTWAGGLNRFDPKTGEFQRYLHDPAAPANRTLANNNIFQIFEDEEGWLWLSVWTFGLQRFNPDTGEFISFRYEDASDPAGLMNGSVTAIEPSRGGWLWIGGYMGLEKYDPQTRRFTHVPLIGKNLEILGLYEDPLGTLWVTTSEGLIRYRPDSGAVRYYTVADGLADPYVAAVEQDRKGRLWLGTRGGLSMFDPQRGIFENFDELDGLPADEFHRFSHLLSRDGIMYFGGPKGLVLFDPENLPRNTHAPNIVLTGFELFQKPVVPGHTYLPRHINLLDRLVLPYDQRDITLKFSALDFISPTKNRYRYRLQGLENNWIEVDSTRRRVRYTNLDPGKYQFQVIGSNNDGAWNEKGVRLDIVIIPPWWMTWWARLLAVMLGLYAIYGFTVWRLRVIRRRERELSIEIEERRAAEKALSLEVEERRAAEKALSKENEERRSAEAKLFHIAYHDALTGLPNRLWLLERLDDQIRRVKSDASYRFALMFIDGDRFKQINDTHGHQLGDFILVSVAKRLETLLPEQYKVARLGGDEFTVLVEDTGSEEEVIEYCNRIIDAFNEPFVVEKIPLFFKVSIGLVFCRDQYTSSGQVLRDADIAMYKAKDRGRGTYQIFDAEMREQKFEMARLEADLYTAFEQNQLFLVYQPIINLRTGSLSGFEALARWRHPEKGLIPPDKFIPIAEESGLIFALGAWVLHQSCAQLAAWIKEYRLKKPPTLAINLSSLELNQSYFLAQVDRVLRETAIDGKLLKLEITESTLMENSESINLLLDELRMRNIELAIDDFGTGYSSLSYLDRLPVQVLKIDRRFVDAITRDEGGSSTEIVKATISLAHNLNIMVVAEGIETEQQYQLLRSYGCDFGQGYHIAKPLSSEDAVRFMGHEPNPRATVSIPTSSDLFGNTGRFAKTSGLRRRNRNRK
jgi:diguanylate cyclase (GGDEF)-like protein